MLLAIDIGNTHVALGLFSSSKLLHHWRLGTNPHFTSDEVAALLRSLFELAEVERRGVSDGIISRQDPSGAPIALQQESTVRLYPGDDSAPTA